MPKEGTHPFPGTEAVLVQICLWKQVHASIIRLTAAAPDTVFLVVRNTAPNGSAPRVARVRRTIIIWRVMMTK